MTEEKKETTAAAPTGDAAAPSGATEGSGAASDGATGSGSGDARPAGAPRKRRRGKRGGRRHRKSPAASAAGGADAKSSGADAEDKDVPAASGRATASTAKSADGSEGSGDGPASKPTRARSGSRSRSSGTRKTAAKSTAKTTTTRSRSGSKAASEKPEDAADAAPADAAETGVASDEGAEGEGTASGAPKRRRRGRRGGRGRRRPSDKPAEGTDGDADASEEKKAPAAGSGRTSTAKKSSSRRGSGAASSGGSTRLAARAMRKDQRGRRRPKRLTEEDAARLRGGEKVMVIHEHDDRTQIALLEEGVLIEHFVARKGTKTSMVGNVFMGRVQNVLPSMEAAFVDFGRGRNGVLYAGEVNYSAEDLEGEAPRIEKVLKSGQSIMVQVTKDPIGSKGARLTTQVSLAGRYLVLAPDQALTGISRRLAEKERARLRQILKDIRPNGHGVIVRTAAEGASEEALKRDLDNLIKIWDKITSGKKKKAPNLLYAEPELVSRVVRDIFSGHFLKIVVDSRDTYAQIKGYLEETAPDLLDKLELHEGPLPAFESYRVTEQLMKALERKVWLPSGGSLIIERTEAMTIIDVNTGKFTGKGSNLEETVFKNNLEAAEEVARQLRLRDIGGIIVIDFIDMIDPKNQKEVLRTLKAALSTDKTRSQVFDVTALGLIEMTRKRVSEGLLEAFSEPCPNCEGRGIVMTHEID